MNALTPTATPPTAAPLALAGLKVLDLTRLLPGAFCSLMLADLGADVLKIEQPEGGDYNRTFPPLNRAESGSFLLLNRNKRSLTLNLKAEEGRAILLKLVEEADVLLEGFRPGVMDRLGLGYETLSALNPRLVYCAISGYGQDGPSRLKPGHDLNYLAEAGALQLFGKAGEGPIVPGLSIADVGGGSLMASTGILAALLSRATTGRGQFVDVSMHDGAISWLALHGADHLFAGIEPKGGERPFIGQAPCYNVYACADGKYVALGLIEPHFWHRFCDAVDLGELKGEQWPQGEREVAQKQILADLFAQKPRDAWVAELEASDIPFGPVFSMEEAFADPHAQHRQMLLSMEHAVEGTIPQLGFPVKYSGTPCTLRSPPPLLGEHTGAVLAGLGYGEDDIAALKAGKVI
ncbi:CaiB/BaiF CoA transferase family protein [Xanthobacter oligotrophicus]|uniref:CaiB/BaiF CoA transferase family protein n=1 Tax=Xanthobacter oligotrophicus TaxID=2607286 RepID=UPI0011F3DF92|nr:CaiB/BaiF CoA-transferase family protein [Xanthobacter oligotrophicus]MCG5237935.1 CoA transferase [Xanthobacter oligotrophicus]